MAAEKPNRYDAARRKQHPVTISPPAKIVKVPVPKRKAK
jgi:hypothetical protein